MSQVTPKLRRLADRLLSYESVAGKRAAGNERAAFRVSERLRHPLSAIVGVSGFRGILARAVTLAKAEAPGLSVVQVKADGSLEGLGQAEPQSDKGQAEGVLIAQLLSLVAQLAAPRQAAVQDGL